MALDVLLPGLASDLETALLGYRHRLNEIDVTTKADHTLLTEADLAVEKLIIDRIHTFDPAARIIAEESGNDAWRPTSGSLTDRIWVIDPIDGTAEFVRPERVEYCSVVCVVERGDPLEALIVAPELGTDRTPIVVVASLVTGTVTINGVDAIANGRGGREASVTRSSGTVPRPFEPVMIDSGYTLKTRTTSQTLDMLRTALDISGEAAGSPRFDLFYRPRQKIWDGLAGLCVGAVVGADSRDLTGKPRTPVPSDILAQPEPTFDSTVLGQPEAVKWFITIAS
jgi:fructose-1,6-bisphosphatase/inositol monophosphatase family enzyme